MWASCVAVDQPEWTTSRIPCCARSCTCEIPTRLLRSGRRWETKLGSWPMIRTGYLNCGSWPASESAPYKDRWSGHRQGSDRDLLTTARTPRAHFGPPARIPFVFNPRVPPSSFPSFTLRRRHSFVLPSAPFEISHLTPLITPSCYATRYHDSTVEVTSIAPIAQHRLQNICSATASGPGSNDCGSVNLRAQIPHTYPFRAFLRYPRHDTISA